MQKLALDRRFGRRGNTKLALDRRFGRPGGAKLLLAIIQIYHYLIIYFLED